MPTLIACLSSGKGTWTEVIKVIQAHPWDKIFLITDNFGKEKFMLKKDNLFFVTINPVPDTDVHHLKEQIVQELKGKIKDFEVALNFISGSGKEHMALLEAVLELGLNFRLISVQDGQVDTLGLRR